MRMLTITRLVDYRLVQTNCTIFKYAIARLANVFYAVSRKKKHEDLHGKTVKWEQYWFLFQYGFYFFLAYVDSGMFEGHEIKGYYRVRMIFHSNDVLSVSDLFISHENLTGKSLQRYSITPEISNIT